ncbi:MAG TPA: YdjY domain-containing protein [Planctomycetota bacterium]|nr:YdjY domain-containing protein [Planctomycetota bacterium]
MRTAAAIALLALLGSAQEPDKPSQPPEPVDVAKILRTSAEFAETCQRFRIQWEENLVRTVGEIAYRGGGPCEYLVNVSPAKAHETIVLLDPGPWTSKRRPSGERMRGYATCLNSALLCAGFKAGRPFRWNEETGETFPPEGDVVHVYVEWQDAKQEPVRARIEDLVWNYRTVDVMQRGKLVYTGSMMIDEGPPNHKPWFGAEVDRLIVACYSTPTALIDNTEEGAPDNGTYEAIHARVPEVGTRVTVLFSKEPLDNVTEFKPLELPEEVLEARRQREAEKKKQAEGK